MSIKRQACIAGAFEHPTRKAPDKTVPQLHAECARGALADAGLSLQDVDGYFCAGDAPGLGPLSMVDYLGLKVRHVDSTDTGGSKQIVSATMPRVGVHLTDLRRGLYLLRQRRQRVILAQNTNDGATAASFGDK